MIVLVALLPAAAGAQSTDVVEVVNGDRFTGSVTRLKRGQLAFGTDSAGTLSITWSDVVHLTSAERFDVELTSGERLTGTIASPAARSLVVETAAGPSRAIDLKEVVSIISVVDGFRARMSGSIDFGLNFTSAQDARTYTLNAAGAHRSREHTWESSVSFKSWLNAQDNADTLTRNDLAFDTRRRLPNRWFALALFEAQQDEQLELDVRILAGAGVGRMLVNSNAALLTVRGGLDYDAERYDSDDEFDHSAELFGGVDWDWFGAASTEVLVNATGYVSLVRQRFRLELDSSLRRDVFWSMHWAFNLFESFDSNPPGDRPRSDLGLSLTLGWSF